MEKGFQKLALVALLVLAGKPVVAAEASSEQHRHNIKASSAALGDNDFAVEQRAATLFDPVQGNETSDQPGISWAAQATGTPVQITGVQVETTEAGFQIVLATGAGELAVPTTSVSGNALIAEIPNAVLALPEGDEFQQFEPAGGIALVQVTGLPGERVQVAITGTNAAPEVEVSSLATALVLDVVPGVAQASSTDDALQIVVTGELEGYRVPSATTGTRTDTPILDIPQAIQVVPSDVLNDQAATTLQEALRNVSGISQGNTTGNTEDVFVIRGFSGVTILQDGFRVVDESFQETANLERIEVLQGPASVLYGSGQPGGVINLVTEQPLSEPFYAFQLRAGSNSFIRPELDISGPLTEDGDIRYRLNAVYERAEGFRNFDQEIERVFLAPVLGMDLGDQTDLTVEFDYLNDERPFDRGLVAIGEGVADIPRDRIIGEPDDFAENEEYRVRYRLEHRFNDNWTLRNAFQYARSDELTYRAEPRILNEVTGDLSRIFISNDIFTETYAIQTEVVGEFNTGPVAHTLLFGIDFSHESGETVTSQGLAAPINIFNPVYEVIPRPALSDLIVGLRQQAERTRWGFYLQDQIDLTDNLILVLGGRFDLLDQRVSQVSPILGNRNSSGQESVFNPRIGLVYQPTETLALYASYSRSFRPNPFSSITADGEFVDPERGTQYEIGIKADWFEGRLSSTLALYDITRTNVAVPDPNAPPGSGFVIPIGAERSRGIGLDVVGEILPGWNVIASYAYINAEITDSNALGTPEGNRVNNVPRNSASLWTTYEIPDGDLQGLGFGLGLFYEGDREGDPANTFELPGYFRTDAAIFYRRDNWSAALNIQNLFDVNYFESAGNSRLRVNPGAPLTILGTISVEF